MAFHCETTRFIGGNAREYKANTKLTTTAIVIYYIFFAEIGGLAVVVFVRLLALAVKIARTDAGDEIIKKMP